MYINKISEDVNLYENYKNIVSPIESYGDIIKIEETVYLLFNPSNHYWMVIDDIGKEIFEFIINKNNIKELKEYLIKKYSINDSIFKSDVIPLLALFLEKKFLSLDKNIEREAKWMNICDVPMEISQYSFSDIYISLSEQCNLDCIYCFNKQKRSCRTIKNDKSLTVEEIVELLKQFKEIGGKGVVFTGGEPLLNKKLVEICEEVKKIDLDVSILTNGTLLDSFDLKKLCKNINFLGISLDTINKNEAEVLWNKSGNYIDKTLYALKKINDIVKEEELCIEIRIMPIFSKINKDSIKNLIDDVYNILPNCNVSWNITKYGPIGIKETDDALDVSTDDYMNCMFEAICNRKNNETRNKKEISKFVMSYSGRFMPTHSPLLLRCIPSFFVTNNGDVFTCQGMEKEENILGNIRNMTLSEMFNSNTFEKMRKCLIVNEMKKCGTCEFRFVCTDKVTVCNEGIEYLKEEEDCKKRIVQKMYLCTCD